MIISVEQISNEGKKGHIFIDKSNSQKIAETATFQNSLQWVGLTVRFFTGNGYILYGDVSENSATAQTPANFINRLDLNELSERSKVLLYDNSNNKLGEIKPVVEGNVGLSVEYKIFNFQGNS